MDTVFIIIAIGALNIACFFIGAKIGQNVIRGEKIEAPNLNPIKAVCDNNRHKSAEKEIKREQERINKILQNIDRYDGTEQGQKDV